LSQEEVVCIIAELNGEWLRCDYDYLRKNCVSFAVVLLEKLGAGPIPTRVSNFAVAGTTLQDSFMQLVTTARSIAVVAKAKMVDMVETSLSFSWYCSGAVALQPLEKQFHLMDRATKAAETGAAAFQQGVDLVILKASQANGSTESQSGPRTNVASSMWCTTSMRRQL